MSSGVIWMVGIYISVLRAANVRIVVINIYWHIHASVAIFVRPWPRPGHPINFNGSFPEQ
jgi:hypothetical protein